ncbi:hypothetical protein ACA758_03865 [Mycoplasmopsis agassizii]|uniref:hypothetical protein n=1 Tax=Mycoplasmopsis agassizii TaxID=33922 RepID=UPI003529CB74
MIKLKYEADGEPLTKEWVIKQIKSIVGEAVTILRAENLQMKKRIEQKIEQRFDDANSKSIQMEKRIGQRLDKVEKQNKETNEKLEAILELLKKNKK